MTSQTGSQKPCFDGGNPFGLEHYGKLERDLRMPDTPPFAHCIARNIADGALSVVRFSPVNISAHDATYWRDRPRRIITSFPDAAAAAATHERHLAQLEKFGLHPWVKSIAPGRCSTNGDIEGVYTQQDLLPDHVAPLERSSPQYKIYMRAYRQYVKWALQDGVYLDDIGERSQGSVLDDQPILHDPEPLYAPHPRAS
ncbi:hypothetical protein EYC59_02635 [Candidatus Saccharibacteria bacterium]|nr:MAG: hypothetical protein EYC59_02635 [Candidatus Saccharibacteria bacterium]